MAGPDVARAGLTGAREHHSDGGVTVPGVTQGLRHDTSSRGCW
jgi:hypothetical protein